MGRIDESDETSKRALAALRECGDKRGVAGCLRQLASNTSYRGAIAEARDQYAQALALYKELGNESGAAVVLANLAEMEFADGHPEEALRSVSESLEMDPSRGADLQNLAMYRSNSAAYRIALGDIDGAIALAREGLTLARRAQTPYLIAYLLQHLALIMAQRGQTQSAAKLLGHVDAQLKTLAQEREPTEQWGYEKLMAALREHLSAAEIEQLTVEGTTWPEDSAEFAAAQRFVAYTLPEILKDPAVREQLKESPTPEELRPMIQVGNFFESLGGFIRHGIVDRDIAISLWSAVVIRNWECLAPALAIMRRTSGPALWEQFEYLTRISHEWTEAHQHGDYPPGVAHMPVTDVWLDADRPAETNR